MQERTLRAWELPKWVAAQARELGLEPGPGAAAALIAQVGERQQRLLRELEKLALELGAGARLDADTVDELAARSSERRVWALADALVTRDAPVALRAYGALTAQGERLESLLYHLAKRMREALGAAERLEAGEAPAQVKRSLRMPAKAADQLINDVRGTDLDALRQAIEALADLELETRRAHEDYKPTAAVRTILRIAA